MLPDFSDNLSDIQSINPEMRDAFVLFCNSSNLASTIQRQLLNNFHIKSAIDFDHDRICYIIPFDILDEKIITKFIGCGWSWDKNQPIIQYLITFYNTNAAIQMYNTLVAHGYNVFLNPNNLQLMVKCLDNSSHNDKMRKLQSELELVEKLSPKSIEDYFNKILFNGKIENTEYRKIRKQEFDVETIQQNQDIMIRGILYQYFNKKIRAYLMRITFPKKFDANTLNHRLIQNINLIRDFLYAVTQEYINNQVTTAINTKHKPIIRFDYLKSCNEYDGFKKVLALAKKWHNKEIIKDKIFKRNLNESNKGVYKIMDLEDGYYVVQLFTPKALDYEGDVLDHCLGDGYYDDKIHEKGFEIYSIRNKRGVSLLTLEINNNTIVQCFGYKNKPLSDTTLRKIVRTFMREQNLTIPDISGWNKLIAYIKQDNVLYDVFDLPKNFTTKKHIDLSGMDLEKLPDMSTVTVNGFFCCTTNKLPCLDGAPYRVLGDCRFGNNPLRSLHGMPRHIGGEISLFNTQLNSKSFVPMYIENKLDDIIGIEEDVIEAWKKQIEQRKSGIQSIMASLMNKERK